MVNVLIEELFQFHTITQPHNHTITLLQPLSHSSNERTQLMRTTQITAPMATKVQRILSMIVVACQNEVRDPPIVDARSQFVQPSKFNPETILKTRNTTANILCATVYTIIQTVDSVQSNINKNIEIIDVAKLT